MSCVTCWRGPSGEKAFWIGRLVAFADTCLGSDCLALKNMPVLFGSVVSFETIFGFVRTWTRYSPKGMSSPLRMLSQSQLVFTAGTDHNWA